MALIEALPEPQATAMVEQITKTAAQAEATLVSLTLTLDEIRQVVSKVNVIVTGLQSALGTKP